MLKFHHITVGAIRSPTSQELLSLPEERSDCGTGSESGSRGGFDLHPAAPVTLSESDAAEEDEDSAGGEGALSSPSCSELRLSSPLAGAAPQGSVLLPLARVTSLSEGITAPAPRSLTNLCQHTLPCRG